MSNTGRRACVNKIVADVKRIILDNRFTPFDDFVFRGQANADYDLSPSISRKSDFLENELGIINLASYRKPDVFGTNGKGEYLSLIAKMQHYGLPTRLLDVTRNALVALYFACYEEKPSKKDGIVYIFKYNIRDTDNAKRANAYCDLWINSRKLGSDKAIASYKEFIKKPMIVDAPQLLMRQQLQQGMYILFPNECREVNGELSFEQRIIPISKDSPFIVGKIVVANHGKKTILEELRALGISRASLFADNIDVFCSEIKGLFTSD